MSKLNKAERKQLQRELIEIWRAAGSPALDDEVQMSLDDFYPFDIVYLGSVQQTYGNASKLQVRLLGRDITAFVAKLQSLRLCKDGTVRIRTGAGRQYDKAKLATAADNALINAAIQCIDLKALKAMDEEVAERIHNRYFVSKLKIVKTVKTAKPEAAHE